MKTVIARHPQTVDELYWWLQAVWGVCIPRTQVCPGHSTPFAAFAEAFFAQRPVSVWKASRGLGGKTLTLGTLCQTEAACLGAQVTILGGSGAQSLAVHEATQANWQHEDAPRHLLDGDPTKFDTRLKNTAWIHSLMASQTSVRGPHPQRLRLDEIDEMDLPILEAAQGQPMQGKRGRQAGVQVQTVMSSTHQHPDGTMSTILKRASEKGWPIHEWCFRESSNPIDGWLTEAEIEVKRSEVPAAMWATEYELQEPNFEGRAIDHDAVEHAFDLLPVNDSDKWASYKHPMRDRRYVVGIDWAKERDRTVVVAFDVTELPWTMIAVWRWNRTPWPVTISRAMQIVAALLTTKDRKRPNVRVVHDSTGIGNVIADLLPNEPVVRDIDRDALFTDFTMQGRDRMNQFTDYIAAIENGELHFPRIDWLYREHLYVSLDDLYGRGHPPDGLVACSLAWTARTMGKVAVLPPPVSIEREASPWLMPTHHHQSSERV